MKTAEKKLCAEIWNDIEPGLRKVCIAKLQSSPIEVDDVVSEAFLALCKKASESGLPENPKAWLYGTVNNLINLKYRKLQQEKTKTVSIINNDYEIPLDYDLSEQVEDKILVEKLKRILEEELSEQEKLLVRLIYEDKLKMKEISKILHTTEAAVKQKHYRLIKHIRKKAKKLFD